MGKNKKAKKAAGNKSNDKKQGGVKKYKAKPVSSNLRRLNLINKNKTEELDKGYSEFRQSVISAASSSKKAQNKPTINEAVHPKKAEFKPTPDLDVTMEDFSKL